MGNVTMDTSSEASGLDRGHVALEHDDFTDQLGVAKSHAKRAGQLEDEAIVGLFFAFVEMMSNFVCIAKAVLQA